MSGRRFTVAVSVALVLCSAAAFYIESVTNVQVHEGPYILFGLAVVWAFVIAGLIARRRRPSNRTGLLMIGIGFAWLTAAFTDSPNDAVFTLGLILNNFWPALLAHLLLSYPTGYLDRLSRRVVIVTYLDTVVLSLLILPFSQPRLDGQGADRNSADNLLLVSHQPGLVRAASVAAELVALGIVVMVLWIVWRRWRSASDATRRVLGPMYLTGAATIVVLMAFTVLFVTFSGISQTLFFYVFTVAFTAIPVGYLFGILRTRLDRSGAVETLVRTLRAQHAPGGLRAALRVALNDPSLDLAYRRPGTDEYLDVAGERYLLPEPSDARAVTTIEHDREPVAALMHDPFLLDDPGLIDAVCGPAALAIENERLQAELRARFQEVSVSERRLRDVLETVQLIAISLDLEGRITFANQYFADLTGWTREELIGQRWLDRFPSGDPEFVERVKADEILVHDEQPLVTKAGDTREILWSNTLTRDVDGAIRGATSIGEDVTERNRSARQEEALRRLATMVAVEAPAGEIFHTVTEDVAQLLDAQTSNLVRFDGPSTGTVVAAWAQA